ncbi:MAG: hypothetical protein ABI083_04245 [Lapillicoccus sp.]
MPWRVSLPSRLLGGVFWLLFSTQARSGAMWLLAAGMAAMLGVDSAWDLKDRFPR